MDSLFANVTLGGIGKSFPLPVRSIPGDREQNHPSEGTNYQSSQVRVDIDMVELSHRGGTAVSSVRCTLTPLVDHSKAEYYYVTGAGEKWMRERKRCSQCADFDVNNWSNFYCKKYQMCFCNGGVGLRKGENRLCWSKHIDSLRGGVSHRYTFYIAGNIVGLQWLHPLIKTKVDYYFIHT